MDYSKIDVVYILGGIPHWKDQELLYSLRSLEQHVKNVRNVILVGRKPSFLNDTIIHIPHVDAYTNKARNIMAKVYRACQDRRFSPEILFLNDDYFFFKDIDAATYPYVYKCDLEHSIKINQNDYGIHVKSTYNALWNRQLPTKNFDTHKPIRFNRVKLREVCDAYDWSKITHGFILKSLYCNTLKIEGSFLLDNKINHPHLKTRWHQIALQVPDMVSIGDMALNSGFKEFLQERFPNKSKFEI